jgi:hypothetical protein
MMVRMIVLVVVVVGWSGGDARSGSCGGGDSCSVNVTDGGGDGGNSGNCIMSDLRGPVDKVLDSAIIEVQRAAHTVACFVVVLSSKVGGRGSEVGRKEINEWKGREKINVMMSVARHTVSFLIFYRH